MRGEMSDAQYRVLMPGPWPGPPQPFHSMRVFYHQQPWAQFASAKTMAKPSCGACPKSLYCLAGKQLFGPVDLHGQPSGFTICRRCAAVIWYQDDIVYLCYRLAAGIFPRCNPQKVDFLHQPGSFSGMLAFATAATIGQPEPDLLQRFFPRDGTCHQISDFGDCVHLYYTFLKEYEQNPIHDRINPFLGDISSG
jgi:hypothetical protein